MFFQVQNEVNCIAMVFNKGYGIKLGKDLFDNGIKRIRTKNCNLKCNNSTGKEIKLKSFHEAFGPGSSIHLKLSWNILLFFIINFSYFSCSVLWNISCFRLPDQKCQGSTFQMALTSSNLLNDPASALFHWIMSHGQIHLCIWLQIRIDW